MRTITPEATGCTCQSRVGGTRRPHALPEPGLISTLTRPVPTPSRTRCTVHPSATR